jgi:hypothetical protein
MEGHHEYSFYVSSTPERICEEFYELGLREGPGTGLCSSGEAETIFHQTGSVRVTNS